MSKARTEERAAAVSLSEFGRLAVLIVNGFGDQLLALPAIRALSRLFGERMQIILGEGMHGFFYSGLSRDIDPPRAFWRDRGQMELDVDLAARRASPCDVFLSLCTWFSPSVIELSRRLGARRTIGGFHGFEHRVAIDERAHMFDQLFTLVRAMAPALKLEEFSAPPRFSAAAEAAAAHFVAKNLAETERMLFVHPETKPEKMWQPALYSEVLRRFLTERPAYKVFVSSVAPHGIDLGPHASRLVSVTHHLELSLALMCHADLFLGIDSCFLHAADLFRVPGIGLFGPTEPSQWGFRFSPRSVHLSGGGSMQGVRPLEVLRALLTLAEVF